MLRKTLFAAAAVVAAAVLVVGVYSPSRAEQPTEKNSPPASPTAWTLEQAREHLRFYPRDAYVQYVALQLARNEGQLGEVSDEIWRRMPRQNRWSQRREQVNLFSLFSGQLAVQESLQLDAMAPPPDEPGQQMPRGAIVRQGPLPLGRPAGPRAAKPGETVAVADLQGPTVKSHPWHEMLGDLQPQVTGLALDVPDDVFFISFHSVGKLLEGAELANQWGAHAFAQANHSAQTQLVTERLLTQLAVEVKPELQTLYNAAVAEAAIVGSDLFFREGSDVTLLFRTRQDKAFRLVMDRMLVNAEQSRADAERTSGQYLDVPYTAVTTPDRQISVYSAYPETNLHVRSNSLAGLQRVLAAVKGRDAEGAAVVRLGETDEFRYVRSLLPEGAAEEDGFIYLSDPFVRRLMSPQVRLTERRRLLCYNHLRMIGHAALLHRTQTGELAQSLAELAESGCAPGEFGGGAFACPDGGEYSLAADGLTGVCTHHGYAGNLTPCLEAEAEHVTEAEADAYRQFVEEYSRFWRRFFDPIAIRVQITPERLRAETLVLPLIDNTVYSSLARALGDAPEALDALPVPDSNIFSVALRFDKLQLLADMGLDELLDVDDARREEWAAQKQTNETMNSMRWILLSMLNYESTTRGLPAPDNKGLSWRVHLLPYLESQDLYAKFHLDEPWDSPHNRPLVAQIPAALRPENDALAAQGKTKFVLPRGAGTLFQDADKKVQLRTVRDGLSNTIALLEVDDEHAVIWTKPEDFEPSPADVQPDLQSHAPGGFLVGMGDGSVRTLSASIEPAAMTALLSRAGGEIVPPDAFANSDQFANRRRRPRPLPPETAALFDSLNAGQLLAHGIGNQIGLHLCDADPTIDLALPRFLGMALGSGGGVFDDELLFIVPMLSAINGPVYVSIPVQDRAIVDDFLQRFDRYLAAEVVGDDGGGWFRLERTTYHLEDLASGEPVRAFTVALGPIKWRFFWSRIDDAVYVASKRAVLQQIADAAARQRSEGSVAAADDPGNVPAHALARIRPQHWNQVLDAYRLGWEENHREACLNNLGPLAALNRAVRERRFSTDSRELDQLAERVYDVQYYCPDGGVYLPTDDGRSVACSIHGTMQHPKQPDRPASDSALGRQLAQFRDLSVRLTFLEDGLHAVVTLQRQPAEGVGSAPTP